MSNNQMSVKEFAKHFNVQDLEAYGFIKFLMAQNLVTITGKRKVEGQRGKPTYLYTLVEGAPGLLGEKLSPFAAKLGDTVTGDVVVKAKKVKKPAAAKKAKPVVIAAVDTVEQDRIIDAILAKESVTTESVEPTMTIEAQALETMETNAEEFAVKKPATRDLLDANT